MPPSSESAPRAGSNARVESLDGDRQARVLEETERSLALAGSELGMPLPAVPVRFDLSGRSAGQFSARGKHCLIRYNPWIFARYFAENLATTVPHEVAHYAVYLHWGRRAKPHGVEWRALMHALGADPAVTFSLDLSGLPVRRQQRHPYRCACSEQALSTTRHRRAQSGRARYACRVCGQTLRYAGAGPSSR